MKGKLILTASLLLAMHGSLAGCTSENAGINPAPLGPGKHAPAKRTILLRNPYGGPADNLLVDGDFEMSVEPVGRDGLLGWVGFDENGSLFPVRAETGGLCRTGLRCAVLEPNRSYWAYGTAAAKQTAHIASLWVKIPDASTCAQVQPILITCDTAEARTELTAGDIGSDGWCHYSAKLEAQNDAVCMYIESDLASAGLMDSAMIIADDGSIAAKPAEYWAPLPDTAARIRAMGQALRARLLRGDPDKQTRAGRPVE